MSLSNDAAGRRVARFVLDTNWQTLPRAVREKAVMCALDTCGAILAGTAAPVADIGRRVAIKCFSGTEAGLWLSRHRASRPGAALANGLAANALDIDDGHRMVKGHPGAVILPALIAAAEGRDVHLQEFLAVLVAAYEVALKAGFTLQQHYNYYHGSGSWGAVGAAAGAARLMGLDETGVWQAMAIADFHAPLTPVMRSVQWPSMSKDGIGWGAMTGLLAAQMAAEGFAGGHTIFDTLAADMLHLGTDFDILFDILDVYFKPYACCRWAHAAIDAVIELRRTCEWHIDDIQTVRLRTFEAAAALYRQLPVDTETAQYNLVYPVAAAVIWGEVGPDQVFGAGFQDARVAAMMKRVEVWVDPQFESEFPARRLCEVEVVFKNGATCCSGVFTSQGDTEQPVTMEWIIAKFHRLAQGVLPAARAERIVDFFSKPEVNPPLRNLIGLVTHDQMKYL